jgi:hypothetical protein
MPPAEFEAIFRASEWPQTHALDRQPLESVPYERDITAKTITLQAFYGSKSLRLPEFLDNRHMTLVMLSARPPLLPLLVAESILGP